MKEFFAIIGGMGTEATESYLHLLNLKTPAHSDQDYLNYVLINHATIPDRTKYILDHRQPNPLKDLIEDIKQQNQFHPEFYVIPCNTAHYFYDQLQKVANAPILHMPREAVAAIGHRYPYAKRVGVIATQGTLHDQIYDHWIKQAGYQLVRPTRGIERQTMHLIYDDVKTNNDAHPGLYYQILSEMAHQLRCDVIILGCTELSLVQERCHNHSYSVIDAQAVLVDHSVQLAEKMQK